MSGDIKANPGSGRICNLPATYKISAPMKSAAPFSQTSLTCLMPPGPAVRNVSQGAHTTAAVFADQTT